MTRYFYVIGYPSKLGGADTELGQQIEVWQKLGITKPRKQEKIDIEKDVSAILLYLKEISPSIKNITLLLRQFQLLRKKEQILKKKNKPTKKIIEQQVKVYDKILQEYEFYQLEADINGERIKKVLKQLAKTAKSAQISKDWLKKINESERWTFDW